MELDIFLFSMLMFNPVLTILTITDVNFMDLLNEKLILNDLKKIVLNETLTRVMAEMEIFKNMYNGEQCTLKKASTRLARLEQETQLLKDMTLKYQKSSSLSAPVLETHNYKLAVGEHTTGRIHLMDPVTRARWLLRTPRGILGLVYHPVKQTFFAVFTKVRSELYSMNFQRGKPKWKRLRRCATCYSLDLDAKVNILYFLEIDRKTRRKIHIQRIFLATSEVHPKPLATYEKDAVARTITVDDVSKTIYVLLRGVGVIDRLDYTGSSFGQIQLNRHITRMTSISVAVDKPAGMLYYTINSDIWRKNLTSTTESEMVWSTSSSFALILNARGPRLLLSYMDTSFVDEWSVDGSRSVLYLGSGRKFGSKCFCYFD